MSKEFNAYKWLYPEEQKELADQLTDLLGCDPSPMTVRMYALIRTYEQLGADYFRAENSTDFAAMSQIAKQQERIEKSIVMYAQAAMVEMQAMPK